MIIVGMVVRKKKNTLNIVMFMVLCDSDGGAADRHDDAEDTTVFSNVNGDATTTDAENN